MRIGAWRLLLPTACALLLGVALGRLGTTEKPTNAQTPAAASAQAQAPVVPAGTVAAPAVASPSPFAMSMRIGSNLYLQTSPEYRALCYQTYKSAKLRLEAIVADDKQPDELVVVMDLDETVFDNSAFQTYLYRTNQEYSDTLWANYEENYGKDVTLVPGAAHFIQMARLMKVNVVFVSNRLQKYQASTVATMKRLGLDRLLNHRDLNELMYLKREPIGSEPSAPSEKTTRREQIGARFRIAMLVGDNLRDFSDVFAKQKKQLPAAPAVATAQDVLELIDVRKALVDESVAHWGTDWFVLPNPVYGEWDRVIKVDPIELMHKTSMPIGAR